MKENHNKIVQLKLNDRFAKNIQIDRFICNSNNPPFPCQRHKTPHQLKKKLDAFNAKPNRTKVLKKNNFTTKQTCRASSVIFLQPNVVF